MRDRGLILIYGNPKRILKKLVTALQRESALLLTDSENYAAVPYEESDLKIAIVDVLEHVPEVLSKEARKVNVVCTPSILSKVVREFYSYVRSSPSGSYLGIYYVKLLREVLERIRAITYSRRLLTIVVAPSRINPVTGQEYPVLHWLVQRYFDEVLHEQHVMV
ncbi:MAG: hypothetical protein DRJ40_07845 [Thermoprotei archaeon]|nr:MAG: hypothetical protein DRJ40_07845 [Thermoprotei archaeon]